MTHSSSDSYVQDSYDHVQSVSADGKKISAYGNSYKRYKLDEHFEVTKSTMLKVTFEATHEAEAHFFCLLKDWHNMNDGRDDCYALGGVDITGSSGSSYKAVNPLTHNGEKNDYVINIGNYFQGPVYYLGFGQDNDMAHTLTKAEGERYVSVFFGRACLQCSPCLPCTPSRNNSHDVSYLHLLHETTTVSLATLRSTVYQA